MDAQSKKSRWALGRSVRSSGLRGIQVAEALMELLVVLAMLSFAGLLGLVA